MGGLWSISVGLPVGVLIGRPIWKRVAEGVGAVLRALGCRPRQVGDVICWQGGVFALCSVAVGVPLGLIVGRVVWRSVAVNTDVLAVVDVPWLVIAGIAVAAIAGAAAVLAIGPAASATRRRPGPELRAE